MFVQGSLNEGPTYEPLNQRWTSELVPENQSPYRIKAGPPSTTVAQHLPNIGPTVMAVVPSHRYSNESERSN